jgi:hypothetical protein
MDQLRFEGIEFARTLETTGAFLRYVTETTRVMMREQPLTFDFRMGWTPDPQLRLFEVDKMNTLRNEDEDEDQ